MKLKLPVFAAPTLGAVVLCSFILAGCATDKVNDDETKNWSAQHLYAQAMDEIQAQNFGKSIKLLESLEARYPYGRYAQQAQLEVAYAYYKDSQPSSAVEACDRFIKLHPTHADVDYAYYLKGLSNFVGNETAFSRAAGQDPSERDPQTLIASLNAFHDLAKKFPNSKYTPDALLRMKLLENMLAEHDMHIALYYFNRKAYVAAAERAQDTLIHFAHAPVNELGLAIMYRSYAALNMHDLSSDSRRVLVLNFPHSVWLDDSKPLVLRGSTQPEKNWWKFWAS